MAATNNNDAYSLSMIQLQTNLDVEIEQNPIFFD